MATRVESTDTPAFSRLTDARRSSSWMLAVPATFLTIALVVLMAWLSARASSRQQQVVSLQHDVEAAQATLSAAQKQVVGLQTQVSSLKDPGRTAVVLRAPAAAQPAGRRGAAPAAPVSSAWGAAIWGEAAGKSWVRLVAYGVGVPPQGEAYMAWFEPLTGDPIALGKVDPSPTGTAEVESQGLPGVDQGKRLFVTLEPEASKAPSTPALFEAPLPKLAPLSKAAP